MPLWRPPVQSNLPLTPVWAALARHNIGVLHHYADGEWLFRAEQLRKVGAEWTRSVIVERRGRDEIDVVVAALPYLPGMRLRLELMTLLMELCV